MKNINIEKIGAIGFCMLITFLSSVIYLRVDKIPSIKLQMDELTRSIDSTNAVVEVNRAGIQDNRERLIFIEASQPLKKGLVTIKNSESLLNYTDPINMIHVDNKRVDKLADLDIINYYQ